MTRAILLACAGLLVLAGCENPQKGPSVISLLPDASASPASEGSRLAQPPFVRGPLPPFVRPLYPQFPMKPMFGGEPGWVPAVGVSNRWTCVVVHHSASDRASPAAMEKAHRDRGWDELGYHFVIGNGIGYPDGKVYVGSRWAKQKHGAHCKVPGNYYNEHGVGICLMGNLDEHSPTAAQMQSLARLVGFLQTQRAFGYDRILTHGGITGRTRCPGRYFSMSSLLAQMNAPLYARR